MSCRIILVRHGETDANRRGCFAASNQISLTDVGRRQAQEVAQALNTGYSPQALFTSPFRRARETSEIIGQALGMPARILPGNSLTRFGCLKGLAYQKMGDMMNKDPSYHPDRMWLWRPENGESLEDVRLRAMGALETVYAQYIADDVVVVCHGAVIQAIQAHVAGNWNESSVLANCGTFIVGKVHPAN